MLTASIPAHDFTGGQDNPAPYRHSPPFVAWPALAEKATPVTALAAAEQTADITCITRIHVTLQNALL